MKKLILLSAILITACTFSYAQLNVTTHAGTGIGGFVDGDALTQAQFSFPFGVGMCVGTDGAVYVADRGNHAIRKIQNGIVTTLAGNGTPGYVDAIGSNARFAFPTALTVDANNNVYVADWNNCVIRKVTQSGVVTTVAGMPGSCGYQDGSSSTAKFFGPYGIAVDNIGNLYVSETGNHVIRKIDTSGTVSTYAGLFVSFSGGYVDGTAATARFARPAGLVFDSNGDMYVTEEDNHTVRKVSAGLIVSTVAGVNNIGNGSGLGGYVDGDALTLAEFNSPTGIAIDNSGNLFVADQYNHRIRKINTFGNVTTIAGVGPVGPNNGGFVDGPDTIARFHQPFSVCSDDSNNLFVADIRNHRIRKITGLVPPLTITASVIDEICEAAGEGSIDLTVTGGTPPYTYSWSNGVITEDIDSLTAGIYIITVTDSLGTSAIESAVINDPPPDPNDPASCSEVFISEYLEGTGQNKAIELFNPTNGFIELNKYFLRVFMNGAPTPLITQLVGVIRPRGTFVIANPNADTDILAVADQTSNKLNFNGDDPVQLVKVLNDISIDIDSIEGIGGNPHAIFDTLDLDTLDHVGIPGVWPGNQGYPVGSGTTKNSTLIRKPGVTSGKEDWACGQKQWIVNGVDDASNLKQHQNRCAAAFPFSAGTIIVRFDSSAVIRSSIDNLSLEFGRPNLFLKPSTINTIQSKVQFDINQAQIIRIFNRMTTADTVSITRLGDTIRMPDFWATFLIYSQTMGSEQLAIDSLNTLYPLVQYAHLNSLFKLGDVPNDNEYVNNQASLHPTIDYPDAHINVETAWDREKGADYVKVGVYDTGIDWTHDDFSIDGTNTYSGSKIAGGWDWVNGVHISASPSPDGNGHGTKCAGIIGALRNNTTGIAGIAGGDIDNDNNSGAQLFAMKIGTASGGFVETSKIADAIVEGAAFNPSTGYGYGLHVLSNSWGNYASNNLIKDAVRSAFNNQATFVAIKFNDGLDVAFYPADIRDEWAISVGASGTDGQYKDGTQNGDAYSSNYGANIDLIAPGTSQIITTTDNNTTGYIDFTGTSAAAPHVSGVAALMQSYYTDKWLVPEDIENILQLSANDRIQSPASAGYDDRTGWGLLDADAALGLLGYPRFKIRHYAVTLTGGAGSSLIASNQKTFLPENRNGVTAGEYYMDVYRYTATIQHNLDPNETILNSWARNSSSNMYANSNPIDPEVNVSLTSVSDAQATIVGYIYNVRYTLSWQLVDKWIPANVPAKLAYTLHTFDPTQTVGLDELDVNSNNVLLGNVYPNPANNSVTISYFLPETSKISIDLFDIHGRLIKTIIQGEQSKGNHIVEISLDNIAQGVYVYRLKTKDGVYQEKLVKVN